MANEFEGNETGTIQDKPKRNNMIWILVAAAAIFILIFLYFATSVFKSQPNGTANSSNSSQSTH